MRYEIMDIDINSWHADGSPVSLGSWIETNNWKDVVEWYKDNQETTAMISATLYISGQKSGSIGGFFSLMSYAKDFSKSGRPTLTGYLQALKIMGEN